MATLDLRIMDARDLRESGNFRIEQIRRARKERENQLIEDILKKAPKVLHWHLTEKAMINDLLERGKCSRLIYCGIRRGLESPSKIEDAFKKFQKVVGSLLKVSFETDKAYVQVTLEITE